MPYVDPEKARARARAYYQRNKDRINAQKRALRAKRAQLTWDQLGDQARAMLAELAIEDRVSPSEELRRLIHREHFTRIMARKA